MIRRVTKLVLSVEQSEGVGARVRRSIGRKEVRLNCCFSIFVLRMKLVFVYFEMHDDSLHKTQ